MKINNKQRSELCELVEVKAKTKLAKFIKDEREYRGTIKIKVYSVFHSKNVNLRKLIIKKEKAFKELEESKTAIKKLGIVYDSYAASLIAEFHHDFKGDYVPTGKETKKIYDEIKKVEDNEQKEIQDKINELKKNIWLADTTEKAEILMKQLDKV